MNTSNRINWVQHTQYLQAAEDSKKSGKPILIYFHSASCKGCERLTEELFTDTHVMDVIDANTIPVWVEVENPSPNPAISALVGSHIFIMSPVLQLISGDGDIYHKFLGSPLHTRLDLGYCRVHHDVPGDISAAEFVASMPVALGKQAMAMDNYVKAESLFRKALGHTAIDSLAAREAEYWLPIAQSRGHYPERITATALGIGQTEIVREVRRFCNLLVQIPDHELMADWPGTLGEGGWVHYTDCLREMSFGAYQTLLDVGNKATYERSLSGKGLSQAQMIISDWQVAFRELQGIIIGLEGPVFDKQHLHENFSLGKQRTVRNNIVHCVMAEFWAHAPAIRATLESSENNNQSFKDKLSPALVNMMRFGPPPYNFGDISSLLSLWEQRHRILVEEFANISDVQLNVTRSWWEDSAVPVRFRLSRLGWHLQDHAAVVETICQRVGRQRTETELLARRIFSALGQAEGAMIGLPQNTQDKFFSSAVTQFRERSDELLQVYSKYLKTEVPVRTASTRPELATV